MLQRVRSLQWLDFLKPVFKAFRIDYAMMKKIVLMKLTMDQRRVPTIFANQTKKRKGNQFIKSLGIYVLYSLILIPLLFLDHYMLQMSLIFGIAMFILMTSMISDFSTVLLDVRDQTFLNTKPVSTRTVNAAKLVHVSIYMIMLTGAFIALPAIVALVKHGVGFFLLFCFMIVFLVMFIITLTALSYITILRFFSGEHLKDFINYVQIILSVSIIIGYQIVIRSFNLVDFTISYVFQWWHLLIPPIWFAAPFELLLTTNHANSIIWLTVLALIVPVLAFGIYFRSMPAFERNLQKLMEETKKTGQKKRVWMAIWAKLLCRKKEERQFFGFANVMMSEEREFKLKVYPSLGMALVFPFIFIFSELNMRSLEDIASGNMFLNIYFSNIIIGTVVYMLQFSGKYKGAWIFKVTPIKNHLLAYSATLKAFIIRLYLPVFILIGAVFVFIFSLRILPDLFVVLLTAILHTLISYKLVGNKGYPFTKPFETAQQGGNTISIFLLMFIAGFFAGAHYLFTLLPFGIYIYMGILMIILIVSWKLSFSEKKLHRNKR
ncbi:hypothetical protein ACLIBG_10155 [Virgibacillus sp. W0181]|uniref:hypothetical protein n=1 Tax=Virgibacillus sp. W0181 TaxID=3391581 RepID=UPI003F452DA6